MYDYAKEKPRIFTETGVEMVVNCVLSINGKQGLFRTADVRAAGDTWLMLAALDYLSERNFIRKVAKGHVGQDDVWEVVKRS